MKVTKSKPSVTVLVPAINEGEILKKVVDACFAISDYKIDVLVVIDSKVTSDTKKVAKASQARVINIGKGEGKGAAVKKSIPHISSEYVIQIDADFQFIPQEIPKLMKFLLKGYDVVLGTRYQKGSKIEVDSVSYVRLWGSYGLSFITSIVARKRITDVMAGFKGFKTNVIKELNPQTNHFGYEAELVVRAAKKGYSIINVPITYKKRVTGQTNVSSIKHGLLVLQTILAVGREQYE